MEEMTQPNHAPGTLLLTALNVLDLSMQPKISGQFLGKLNSVLPFTFFYIIHSRSMILVVLFMKHYFFYCQIVIISIFLSYIGIIIAIQTPCLESSVSLRDSKSLRISPLKQAWYKCPHMLHCFLVLTCETRHANSYVIQSSVTKRQTLKFSPYYVIHAIKSTSTDERYLFVPGLSLWI